MLGIPYGIWIEVYKVLAFLQFYSKETQGRDTPWETGVQSTKLSFFLSDEFIPSA